LAYLRWRRLLELTALDRPRLAPLLLRGHRSAPQAPPEAPADVTAEWDAVYQRGAYERLWRSDQRHHHRLLAALVAEARPHPTVLEVGCGEGVFFASLRSHTPAGYLGVDVAPLGIAGARKAFDDPIARFEVADGRTFEPPATYDVIVFPECLEYLGEPADVLAHYRRFLKPGGVFGVSMWMSASTIRLWRRLETFAAVRDQAVVLSDWGGGWIVAVLD
jgi:SAM-dependent methyltransferase